MPNAGKAKPYRVKANSNLKVDDPRQILTTADAKTYMQSLKT